MADDIQRLIVSLEAQTTKFVNAMNKANGVANKNARKIENRFNKMNTVVSRSFARLGAYIGGGLVLREAKELLDAATRIENSLKIAGYAGDELVDVYDKLFASSQKNYTSFEQMTQLFTRATLVQKELGVTTEELLKFTDNVGVALRVTGQSADQTRGAMLQLGQALATGVVRAEEYNSLQENAVPLLRAAAAGLKEAGGSVGTLTNLVKAGKVSSEAFFRAIEAGAPILEEKLVDAEPTISQAFQNLRNSLIKVADEFDDTTDASGRMVDGIETLSSILDNFDMSGFVNEISSAKKAMDGFLAGVGNSDLFKEINEYLGYTENGVGKSAPPGLTPVGVAPGSPAPPLPPAIDVKTREIKPVSLDDFELPDDGKGGRKSDPYGNSVESIQERTAALQAETAALQSLNPLVNDYGYAVEKAKAEHELLTAAQEAGVAITPELQAQISALAEGYAQAQVEAAKLAEQQANLVETFGEFKSLASDVLKGFVSDIRSGVDASEALVNALGKIQDKLLDMALDAAINALFSNLAGAIGGGIGGGQLSIAKGGGIGLYAKGGVHANGRSRKLMRTFSRGGISNEAAIFGEAGPEAAVPLPDGRTIPVTLKTPKVAASSRRSESAVMIELSPDLEARILQEAQDNSIKVVGRAAPSIVSAATGQTAKQFANGGYDKVMNARFGTRANRIQRG